MAVKKEKSVDDELEDDGAPQRQEANESENESGKKTTIKNDTDDDSGDDSDDSQEEKDEIDPKDIPTRRSVAQNIIARQQRTIKKLRSQVDDDEDDGGVGFKDDEQDGDGDVQLEARDLVRGEIDKAIRPVVKALADKSDEDELKGLLSTEPEAKKYEKRIRAYMGHENYQGVPPSVIYHHLAFKDSQNMGASKRQIADDEANELRGAGSGRRPVAKAPTGDVPSIEEMKGMDDATFERLQNKARMGRFVKKQ